MTDYWTTPVSYFLASPGQPCVQLSTSVLDGGVVGLCFSMEAESFPLPLLICESLLPSAPGALEGSLLSPLPILPLCLVTVLCCAACCPRLASEGGHRGPGVAWQCSGSQADTGPARHLTHCSWDRLTGGEHALHFDIRCACVCIYLKQSDVLRQCWTSVPGQMQYVMLMDNGVTSGQQQTVCRLERQVSTTTACHIRFNRCCKHTWR